MIKKLAALLPLVLLLPLTACGYSEADGKYAVSSLGFSYAGEYTVYAETVSVGTDKATAEPRIFKSTGKTARDAVKALQKNCSKTLMLGHCAAVILGEGINERRKEEIFDFCKNEKSFNIGASAVLCKDVKRLLESVPETATVGYDIIGILKRNGDENRTKIYKTVGGEIMLYTFENRNEAAAMVIE